MISNTFAGIEGWASLTPSKWNKAKLITNNEQQKALNNYSAFFNIHYSQVSLKAVKSSPPGVYGWANWNPPTK